MILKYAIALAVLLVLTLLFTWAFLPARYLPGNRARHLRIRLHLRLHPGKGFAHLFSLWLRWGRLAAHRSGAPAPPSTAEAAGTSSSAPTAATTATATTRGGSSGRPATGGTRQPTAAPASW